MGYLELDDDEQVEALRPVAVEAAGRFGLEVARLEMVLHAYNTTFAVDTTDGRRLALRVNTNSGSTPAEVLAQQDWQLAIAAQTAVLVPRPLRTVQGEWLAEVESDAFGRSLVVTCASWLDGPDVVEADTEVAHELGRTMALLHQHARGWSLPAGGAMPTFDGPLFGDTDLLDTARDLSGEDRLVIGRAREVSAAAFSRVYAAAPVIALHADLHGGNLKWHQGRLAVFDFDDCGFGVPALDLAVSTFYLRGTDPAPEAALRAGYAEVAPLPEITDEDAEGLIAGRQLLLANALLGSSTAEFAMMARSYLPQTVVRLRHFLQTGRFTREVTEATS